MEKHFANYEQSLALKELGFNERVSRYFEDCKSKLHPDISGWDFNTSFTNCVSQPLKSQVFEWVRKEHKIEATVACFYSKRLGILYEKRQYHCYIVRDGITTKGPKFKTYEEAESACIDKLIELLK